MILKEEKNKIITEYATHEGDTGSPEVQIAVLTNRINSLTKHMQQNPKDFHSIGKVIGKCNGAEIPGFH